MEKIITLTKREAANGTYTGYGFDKLIMQFAEGRIVDGVYRWDSNDRVPFDDMLADFINAGFMDASVFQTSMAAKKVEDQAAIMEYISFRKTNGYSAEEKAEALAAGATGAVDIFTGKSIFA